MISASQIAESTPGSAASTAALVLAWRNIRAGGGSRADFEVVMADLAAYSGYFDNPAVDDSNNAVQRWIGRREICARIFFLTELKEAALDELRDAAAAERQLRDPENQ